MAPRQDEVYWRIPSKLAIVIISILLTGAISFNVWAVTAVYERPTRKQITHIIETESPYKEDRKMILLALDKIHDELEELKQLLRIVHGTNK
jgi:hypothetical protein